MNPLYESVRKRLATETNSPSANIVIKSGTLSKEIDQNSRMVYGWATRERIDQENQVVIAGGVDLDTYFPKMVKSVYFNHDLSEPVGTARRCYRKGDGIFLDTYVLDTPFGKDLMTMIEAEAVGHYSIGGVITNAGPATEPELVKYGPNCELVLRSVQLREVSLVSMPCLPDAVLTGVVDKCMSTLDELLTKSYIKRTSAVRAGLDTTPTRKYHTVDISLSDECGTITFA